jgi:hypothetical protein
MSLLPITKAGMRNLKAEEDERIRKETVDKIVRRIYTLAVAFAKTSTVTHYNYDIPPQNPHPLPIDDQDFNDNLNLTYEFYMENIKPILRDLGLLFPKCLVLLKESDKTHTWITVDWK